MQGDIHPPLEYVDAPRTSPPPGHHRRRFCGPLGHPGPGPREDQDHPARPPQPPPVPTPAVPGRHRWPVRPRYRRAAAPYPRPPAQRGSAPGRGRRHRQDRPPGAAGRRQHPGLRQPAAGHRRHPRLLRQRPVGRRCAGPEDPGRCHRPAPQTAVGLRACRGRTGPGEEGRLAEFRGGRRRPYRRRTGRHSGRDRPPHPAQ